MTTLSSQILNAIILARSEAVTKRGRPATSQEIADAVMRVLNERQGVKSTTRSEAT